MFTDIVGYTALMGSDEDKAFAQLNRKRVFKNRTNARFQEILKKIKPLRTPD